MDTLLDATAVDLFGEVLSRSRYDVGAYSGRVRLVRRSGLVAGPWIAVVLFTLGSMREGYDHSRHVMSLLGESGYALAWAMNLFGFGALGLLTFLFALALHRSFPTRRGALAAGLLAVAGLAILAIGALPCDPGCREVSALGRFHSPAASVAAAAMVGSLLLFAWEFQERPEWRAHARATLVLCIPALVGGALYVLRVQPYIGLWQRLALAGPLVWMAMTAWRLRPIQRDR